MPFYQNLSASYIERVEETRTNNHSSVLEENTKKATVQNPWNMLDHGVVEGSIKRTESKHTQHFHIIFFFIFSLTTSNTGLNLCDLLGNRSYILNRNNSNENFQSFVRP